MYNFLKMFGYYRPLTLLFEDDPGKDPNNPDLSGGEPEPGKSGNGESQPNPSAGVEKIEIVVDGEKRQITMDEAINLAQKASGAEKRFEEASKMRKKAENGLRLTELINRFNDENHTPTEEEIREMSVALKIDAEELMANLNDNTKDQNDKNKNQSDFDFDTEFQKRFGKTPAEAKLAQDYNDSFHVERAKEKIRELSDKSVDKDEIFGKMIVGEGGENRLAVIKDMVADEVLRRIMDGTTRDQAVTESVQKIRSYLTKYGIPGKPDQHPITLGLAPGQTMPSEVVSDEPIKRIDASEDDAEDNFVKRWQQKALQLMRNKPK